jgi:hypothetical protein
MTLLYLPFGKFFHIFQRPLHLAVILYRTKNEAAPATCRRCGQGFAGVMHVEDLQKTMADCGFQLDIGLCPPCKRRRLGIAQARTIAKAVGHG